jgi:hypothetical protein
MDIAKPDYSKLPDDLKAKLLKWEANNPANKQVQLLTDIADLTQEMLTAMDDERKGSNKAIEHFGSLLVDMREQLTALNAKEAPETPDNSKPVIDAISKLEKALTAQKAPVVNVAKADAPVVNVDVPNITIDNKEISKILKTDLPKAFNEAVRGIVIPENDDSQLLEAVSELAQKLDSIDTGVRLKPQAPNTIGITGVTVSNGAIPVTQATLTKRFDTSSSPILYTATAPVGTADASLGWTITKFDLTNPADSSGKIATDVSWTDRATGSFN